MIHFFLLFFPFLSSTSGSSLEAPSHHQVWIFFPFCLYVCSTCIIQISCAFDFSRFQQLQRANEREAHVWREGNERKTRNQNRNLSWMKFVTNFIKFCVPEAWNYVYYTVISYVQAIYITNMFFCVLIIARYQLSHLFLKHKIFLDFLTHSFVQLDSSSSENQKTNSDKSSQFFIFVQQRLW